MWFSELKTMIGTKRRIELCILGLCCVVGNGYSFGNNRCDYGD